MNPFAPTPEPENWRLRAACRGTVPTAVFFTTRTGPGGIDAYPPAAIAACAGCSVRAACLDDALTMPSLTDQGYRAGLSAKGRRQVRRARANAARRAS